MTVLSYLSWLVQRRVVVRTSEARGRAVQWSILIMAKSLRARLSPTSLKLAVPASQVPASTDSEPA